MRTLTIPAALLLATVFAAGCDQKAPTELSEGELGPQFNQAPVVFTESDEFDTFNPCTGLLHTNFADITVRVHESDNHVVVHNQFDIVTSDGFSGRAAEHFVENLDNGEVTFVANVNVNLSNDSRQRLSIHIVAQFTIRNGDVRVDIFTFSSTCVGKPNA